MHPDGGGVLSGVEKLWEELLSLSLDEVSSRTLAERTEGGLRLKYLGKPYLVRPGERTISRQGEGEPDPRNRRPGFLISLLFYLVHAKEIPPSGKWISPKDLPGGRLFFRGRHDLSTGSLERKYGRDPQALISLGESLGGKRIEIGDAGIDIPVFPRISFGLVLWKGDEEYPPRIDPLVDSRIALHFPEPLPLDAIQVSLQEALDRLAWE